MAVHAKKLMTRRLATVYPEDPITWAAEKFWETGYSALPVVDAYYHLVGIISAADVLYALQQRPGTSSPRPWAGQ